MMPYRIDLKEAAEFLGLNHGSLKGRHLYMPNFPVGQRIGNKVMFFSIEVIAYKKNHKVLNEFSAAFYKTLNSKQVDIKGMVTLADIADNLGITRLKLHRCWKMIEALSSPIRVSGKCYFDVAVMNKFTVHDVAIADRNWQRMYRGYVEVDTTGTVSLLDISDYFQVNHKRLTTARRYMPLLSVVASKKGGQLRFNDGVLNIGKDEFMLQLQQGERNKKNRVKIESVFISARPVQVTSFNQMAQQFLRGNYGVANR